MTASGLTPASLLRRNIDTMLRKSNESAFALSKDPQVIQLLAISNQTLQLLEPSSQAIALPEIPTKGGVAVYPPISLSPDYPGETGPKVMVDRTISVVGSKTVLELRPSSDKDWIPCKITKLLLNNYEPLNGTTFMLAEHPLRIEFPAEAAKYGGALRFEYLQEYENGSSGGMVNEGWSPNPGVTFDADSIAIVEFRFRDRPIEVQIVSINVNGKSMSKLADRNLTLTSSAPVVIPDLKLPKNAKWELKFKFRLSGNKTWDSVSLAF